MGKIFCVMGKSASGKDTVYNRLLADCDTALRKIIPYTTRPIRDGERDGETYYFCTEDQVRTLADQGRIIELREYNTVYGIWKYFTADDGQIDLAQGSYLLIGTLDTFLRVREYFGRDRVVPIYIEVEDGERLLRAIAREQKQTQPKYEEMCRRFLADAADFSEENLRQAGVTRRFVNRDLNETVGEIREYIRTHEAG